MSKMHLFYFIIVCFTVAPQANAEDSHTDVIRSGAILTDLKSRLNLATRAKAVNWPSQTLQPGGADLTSFQASMASGIEFIVEKRGGWNALQLDDDEKSIADKICPGLSVPLTQTQSVLSLLRESDTLSTIILMKRITAQGVSSDFATVVEIRLNNDSLFQVTSAPPISPVPNRPPPTGRGKTVLFFPVTDSGNKLLISAGKKPVRAIKAIAAFMQAWRQLYISSAPRRAELEHLLVELSETITEAQQLSKELKTHPDTNARAAYIQGSTLGRP